MEQPEEPAAPMDTSWLDDVPDGERSGDGWVMQEGKAEEMPTEFALKLDKWGQRQGEELQDLKEFKDISATPEDISDMFGMAFDYDPTLNDSCKDPHKLEYVKSMLTNESYQALRGQTRLDKMASEFAALHFSREWTTYKEAREKQEQKDKKDGKDGQPPSPKEQLRQEMKTAAAVNRAVEAAQQEVNDLNDARQALGIGNEGGGMQGMSPANVKKMFQRVKNNPSLRKMLDLAGRYRLAARAKQRIKVRHGYDDMVGVTQDNEISRLLPSEMAALAHPVLKIDAIRRFAERQMACREYRGVEEVAKGPILIIIDESGSMSGERIENAKALALAMAWVARHQKRWCGFIGFSGAGETRSLALPPNKWPADAVMKWLEGFLGGGTVLPVKEVPQLYNEMGAPKGKTDLICITDGDTSAIGPNEKAKFLEWKRAAQCKLIGITIASPAQILQGISDEFYRIPRLSPDNDAVERVLGI